MPALTAIFGADATPYANAMLVAERATKRMGDLTSSEMRKAITQIEGAMESMRALGGSTAFYESQLKNLNAALADHETKTQMARQATEALALSRAKVAAGTGDEADLRAVMLANATRAPDRDAVARGLAKRTVRQQLITEYQEKISNKSAGAEDFAKKSADAKAAALADARNTVMFGVQGQGGAFSGINAGATQIIHSFRATFDSIASGIPINRVLLQQLPQIGQGLFLMGAKLPGLSFLMKDGAANSLKLSKSLAEQAAKSGLAALATEQESAAAVAAGSAKSKALQKSAAAALVAYEADKKRATMAADAAAMDIATLGKARFTYPVVNFLNKPLFGTAGAEAGSAFLGGLRSKIAGIPLLIGGLAVASVAAIIGSFFIFKHRVESLALELAGTLRDSFNVDFFAKSLSKAETLAQLQKNVTEEVRRTQEAHDAVAAAMDRELALTKDRLGFERELLELQKQNELAKAATPGQREAIEKKYSKLLLANRKAERDAELENMRQTAAALPDEIKKAKTEIQSALTAPGYMSEAQDKANEERLKRNAEAAQKYQEQLPEGTKDERKFSADLDRKTIEKLERKRATSTGFSPFTDFNETDAARLEAAKNRLKTSQEDVRSYRTFANAGDDRARARARVQELEKKVSDDEKRLAELTGSGKGKGVIADKERTNLQRDKEDLRLEEERLKRNEKTPAHFDVTGREKIGLGFIGGPQTRLIDVAQAQHRTQQEIARGIAQVVANTKPKNQGNTHSEYEQDEGRAW